MQADVLLGLGNEEHARRWEAVLPVRAAHRKQGHALPCSHAATSCPVVSDTACDQRVFVTLRRSQVSALRPPPCEVLLMARGCDQIAGRPAQQRAMSIKEDRAPKSEVSQRWSRSGMHAVALRSSSRRAHVGVRARRNRAARSGAPAGSLAPRLQFHLGEGSAHGACS